MDRLNGHQKVIGTLPILVVFWKASKADVTSIQMLCKLAAKALSKPFMSAFDKWIEWDLPLLLFLSRYQTQQCILQVDQKF